MRTFSAYRQRIHLSFAAVYALLERPRVARRAVVALLVVHSGLLAYSAFVHSPTLNEPGHLVAGLSNWKFGRFDTYCVNPPLVRMVAALPVMSVGYEEDWSGSYTGPGARPEFSMGEDFVAANGERSFFLFMIARWACIPFSCLGGIICYLWARDLYGRPAGVMACSTWCFEPNILAHASLMTPDAHATALGLTACYTFWRWLKQPTWTQAALTGVVLGLAELAKTTLILFYPLWPLMWIVYRWPDRGSMFARSWFREGGMLALRMFIGVYVLNLGYGFEGSLRPLGEFHFVSTLLTEGEAERDQKSGNRSQEKAMPPIPVPGRGGLTEGSAPTNRFAASWLRHIPVPFPKNYLLGIDLQQKDFEHFGRLSYLRGEWRNHGWWYYYLYAIAIKVPLGLLILTVFALTLCLWWRRRAVVPAIEGLGDGATEHEQSEVARAQGNSPHCSPPILPKAYLRPPIVCRPDLFILLFAPLVIFVVVSAETGFNEHMRYVLPCLPFMLISASGCFGVFVDIGLPHPVDCPSYKGPSLRTFRTLTLALLLWSVVSSCWIYPHSLSYFNECVGGPKRGSQHVLGSNLDWGQDLRYLSMKLNAIPSPRSVYLAYYGFLAPCDLGVRNTTGLSDAFISLSPVDHSPHIYLAISENLLKGVSFSSRYGPHKGTQWIPRNLDKAIDHWRIYENAGYSITIFQPQEQISSR